MTQRPSRRDKTGKSSSSLYNVLLPADTSEGEEDWRQEFPSHFHDDQHRDNDVDDEDITGMRRRKDIIITAGVEREIQFLGH